MRALALVALLVPVSSFALDISWVQPTEREDGTPLPVSEIAGYRLVWMLKGQAQPDVTVPPGTTYVLNPPFAGRVCATLQTIDTDGLESVPSNTACKNAKPGKPINLRFQ